MKDEPAFPRTAHACMTYEDLGSVGGDPQTGMTLRDYFAAHAAAAYIAASHEAHNTLDTTDDLADFAYATADAMLRRRAAKGGA